MINIKYIKYVIEFVFTQVMSVVSKYISQYLTGFNQESFIFLHIVVCYVLCAHIHLGAKSSGKWHLKLPCQETKMIKIEHGLPPLERDIGDSCSDLVSQIWSYVSMLTAGWAESSTEIQICKEWWHPPYYDRKSKLQWDIKKSDKWVGVSGQWGKLTALLSQASVVSNSQVSLEKRFECLRVIPLGESMFLQKEPKQKSL